MASPKAYKDYLAENILSESTPVTYRLLSRALKVHSNVAKQLLYDFHRTQNARKQGCVHATYLISGVPVQEENDVKSQQVGQPNGASHPQGGNGENSLMQDGSFMSRSLPEPSREAVNARGKVPVTSITLVQEEDLDAVKALYQKISSIHVYSLEPGHLQNIQVLSECNYKINADYSKEDALETWKQYGTIYNPQAKRRTARVPPAPSALEPPTTAAMKSTAKHAGPSISNNSTTTAANSKAPTTSTNDRPPSSSSKSDATPRARPMPSNKRTTSSTLFQSFAKTKPSDKKKDSEPERSRSASMASESERSRAESVADQPMPDATASSSDSDEPDPEDAAYALDSKANREKAAASKAAQSEREKRLQKMMDDDEGSSSSGAGTPKEKVAQDSTNVDADMLDAPEAGTPEKGEADEDRTDVPGPRRRRRGRRQVLKKKTTKDKEGYLVTSQEPVWESFSESERDEAPARKAKTAMGDGEMSRGTGGEEGKKGAGSNASGRVRKAQGQGQGNIMNFFGKK